MKNDYTHLSIILDRTGSMETIRDDTIGGFNAFLESQQTLPGAATLTLVQFDSQDPFEVVYNFRDLSTVPKLTRETFVPRAATPLLDAMGRGINDLEQNLSEMAEEHRPSKIVMVLITDGHENASREFTKDQIRQMIRNNETKRDWQFVFLGCDLDGISDARSSGIAQDKALHFRKDAAGTRAAFCSVGERVSEYRKNIKKAVSFEAADREAQQD